MKNHSRWKKQPYCTRTNFVDSAVENNFDFNRGEDWVTYYQVKRKVDTINDFIRKTKFEVTRE